MFNTSTSEQNKDINYRVIIWQMYIQTVLGLTTVIIGRSSTNFIFFADRKSKMAATAIHRLTLDPMEKCSKLQI